jgi:hypothetical protein
MGNKSGIDPLFFDVIASWFNVDLIDLNDKKELDNTINVAAADLNRNCKDIDCLIAQLENALSDWNSNVVMDFIKATDVDWLFDNNTEEQLKSIVIGLINALNYFAHKTRGDSLS